MLVPKKNRLEVYKYLFRGAQSSFTWPGVASQQRGPWSGPRVLGTAPLTPASALVPVCRGRLLR